VTSDDTLGIQLLGSTEVVGVGVDEEASIKTRNGHLDCEVGVLINVL